ncbi:MAG: hypothetical protein JOZ72_10630 [Alphaproteobacteria bacterium]|nr:hypothetical protein [Alphaproteobacteria bacterium]
MRCHSLISSLLCGACFAFAAAADAGTLIPVPPVAGAASTSIFDVNDNLEISGMYKDGDGVEHGFFGTLGGDYTLFDYPGETGTEARSINNAGYVLGFAPDDTFAAGPEFLRKPDGTIITILKDGVPLSGIAQGLAPHQVSTGDYVVTDLSHKAGYRGKNGKYKADVVLGVPTTRVAPRDITPHGAIAGFFNDGTGTHGFILKHGVTQVIDADASGTTALEGLSDRGILSGQVQDGSGNSHAFTLDTDTSTITWIDVPGSTNQQAWGINRQGFVAVSSDNGSYIYCPLKPSRCPSGGTAVHARTTRLTAQHTEARPQHATPLAR